ncbi:FAS1 domain-containing protein [Coniophora puteana RWD-64-598 SS2]|uniref:FAS1 domain-containing protein n=1 Tax=Coniophora puteana (strain RWD-64-598) TaxID=741705 RepID=A0A5M3M9C0_CONPW|nr:FAS1 domain-containing protein [Coniophora puteana RWD-64-598 SS2]EIW75759.1 FAS1 domain-containing protein [Coniophora puteana RWD-64-598 SS2]
MSPTLSLILALVPAVLSQQSNLTSFSQQLNSTGLNALGGLVESLNQTEAGRQVIDTLASNNVSTVFAPSNDALTAFATDSQGTNASDLGAIFSYHILPGNYTNMTTNYPNVTLGRTLLNGSSYVNMPGNASQVLIWSRYPENGTLFAFNNGTNVSVTNASTIGNMEVYVIDHVLRPPGNMSAVLQDPRNGITNLSAIIASMGAMSDNGGNETRVTTDVANLGQVLDETPGITIFAPSDEAMQRANSSLNGLASNTTALSSLIGNHIVNGSALYSTLITPNASGGYLEFTTASGEPMHLASNSSGLYVQVNSSPPARVVRTDLLARNGVVHVIDNVLVDTTSDVSKASSAYESATSAARTATAAAAGPVTAAPGQGQPGSGQSGSSGGAQSTYGVLPGLGIGVLFLAVGWAL